MTVEPPQDTAEDQYSRPYKSRRQRPCDFCRKRKSCCIIEGTLPCKLCRNFKRECTFLEGPISRPKPKVDENGQRIVHRKRSASAVLKKDSLAEEKPKKKRGRKPKAASEESPTFGNPEEETSSAVTFQFTLPTDQDTSLIDPALVKPSAIRRFSAPVQKRAAEFDLISDQQDLLVTTNDVVLENLHYSLEDHDHPNTGANNGNTTNMNNNGNTNWRNIYGYLVDSPLLQPQRLNDVANSPFLSNTTPELSSTRPSSYSSYFSNVDSTATSTEINTIRPTESISSNSFNSPGSSISNGVQHRDIYPETKSVNTKTLSGFQFIQPESSASYIDPFIFSLMGNDNSKDDILLSENVKMNRMLGPVMMSYSTDDTRKMSSKYMGHQRKIFSILDNYGDKLINLYLTYVNPFIPILSKSQISFIFNEGDFTKSSVISSLKRMNLALVSSIIASALEYWDLDNELILDESPSVDEVSMMAFDLIFSEFDLRNYSNAKSEFDLLQACLIICIKFSFDVTKLDHLYKINILSRLISIAHSIVIDLGLNVDPANFATSPEDDEHIARTNLWWCFYLEEKWLSLLTGRQSLIHEDNYNVKVNIRTPSQIVPKTAVSAIEPRVDAQFADYESLHKTCSKYFEEMIKLTLILAEVLNKFYKMEKDTGNLSNEQQFKKLFEACEQANELEEKLLRWRDLLPSEFTFSNLGEGVMNDQTRIGGFVNARATLQISYYVVFLSVFKALLKKFSNKYMSLSTHPDNNSLIINDTINFTKRFNKLKLNAIKVSIDCAKTIKTLKLQDLNGFWYAFTNFKFIFITNFYILLLMVLDKTANDLTPILPGSDASSNATPDASATVSYNNNLQFKSTMQKIITDIKCCMKNRSSKWKIVRLANDLFTNMRSFEDFDIVENYANSSGWNSSPGSSLTDGILGKGEDNLQSFTTETGVPANRYNEPEPLSLDDDMPRYEIANYEDKFVIV